jgi:hypothetical protein
MLALCLAAVPRVSGQDVPTPESFFGHRLGAEKKVARWDGIVEYMQRVAANSDRVQYHELGRTTGNNPFVLLVISSPNNLKSLDRLKEVNRKLTDPRRVASDAEAAALVEEGKIFVLITSSIHASEIGATQMSGEGVYRLATDNSPQTRKILDNVVLLWVPCMNPDGQIMVVDWYNRNLGSAYEAAPLPWLDHPYVGHDNNRDAYMFTQKETQLLGRVLYHDWLPEVWLDQHQMWNSGPRIFVMPATDPINPNVDPLVYRNVGMLGFGQAAALERAGKEGIIHGDLYTYWWEGAMAWTGWWHNILGLLTEVAWTRMGTSVDQEGADPNRRRSAAPAEAERSRAGAPEESGPLPPPTDLQSRSNYPRPWRGGAWTLRDIVEYDFISTFGLLETSADLRAQLLDGVYAVAKRQIDQGRKGDPFAIVVRRDQADPPTVVKLLQTLALGGVEIHQAQQPFKADDRSYPAGAYVILLAQPFRAYAKDLLEPQVYPKVSPAPGVPPRPPYDVAGWSLGMQMGVDTVFVSRPFQTDLKKLDRIELPPGCVSGRGSTYLFDHAANNSLVAVSRFLKAGSEVFWLSEPVTVSGKNFGPGAIAVRGGSEVAAHVASVSRSLGIDALACDIDTRNAIRIRAPRTALYQPWGGNVDEGWTRWLLEQYEYALTTVHPQDVRKGNLRSRFDAFILPDLSEQQILNGLGTRKSIPEPYQGGIDESGVKALQAFIDDGGSVIALGQSSMLLMNRFSAPYRDGLRGVRRDDFFCPGSLVRVLVDNTHPIAYGMREEAIGFFANSMALEAVPSFSNMQPSIVVRYPASDILKSGWLQGDTYLYNKVAAAEVLKGKGRMILLPLRVQNRAQTHGTFKLLFNSILTSATEPAEGSPARVKDSDRSRLPARAARQ